MEANNKEEENQNGNQGNGNDGGGNTIGAPDNILLQSQHYEYLKDWNKNNCVYDTNNSLLISFYGLCLYKSPAIYLHIRYHPT